MDKSKQVNYSDGFRCLALHFFGAKGKRSAFAFHLVPKFMSGARSNAVPDVFSPSLGKDFLASSLAGNLSFFHPAQVLFLSRRRGILLWLPSLVLPKWSLM